MPQVVVNYLAVFGAAVVSMVIGALWYSPLLFGKMWMTMSGITPDNMESMKKGMGAKYGVQFVMSLVMAYVLTHMLQYAGATTIGTAMQGAFWLWLGFVVTVGAGMVLWEKKPIKLYFLMMAHELVSIAAMAIVVVLWR